MQTPAIQKTAFIKILYKCKSDRDSIIFLRSIPKSKNTLNHGSEGTNPIPNKKLTKSLSSTVGSRRPVRTLLFIQLRTVNSASTIDRKVRKLHFFHYAYKTGEMFNIWEGVSSKFCLHRRIWQFAGTDRFLWNFYEF